MLEDLDKVDWAELGHEEIPDLLKRLAAGETDQEITYWIFDAINHQGSLYPVTPYVIPLLNEILTIPNLPTTVDILQGLAYTLTSCFVGTEISVSLHLNDYPSSNLYDRVSPTLLLEVAEERVEDKLIILHLFIQALEQYRAFLRHPSWQVQWHAFQLLYELCYEYENFYEDALEVGQTASEDDVKAAAIYALGTLNPHLMGRKNKKWLGKSKYVDFAPKELLNAWLAKTAPRQVQLATAMSLGYRVYHRLALALNEPVWQILVDGYLYPIQYKLWASPYTTHTARFYDPHDIFDLIQILAKRNHLEGLKQLAQAPQLGLWQKLKINWLLLRLSV
jgi:hypothetical protein